MLRIASALAAGTTLLAMACSDGGVVGGKCRSTTSSGCGSADPSVVDGASDAGEGSVAPDAASPDGGPSMPPSIPVDAGADAAGDDAADAEAGGGGADSDLPECALPAADCAGSCVDLTADPGHCGACHNQCPSGICQDGSCIGTTAGHSVLLCMSFEHNAKGSPQTALVGNAVFLRPGPLRILGYAEHAPKSIVNGVNQAIAWAAAANGRTYAVHVAQDAESVTADLPIYDVLLVYDQTSAPAGTLAAVGSSWAPALASFLQGGGVAVVQSGGGGTGEMGALLTSAGLLPVSAQPLLTGSILYNRAPADAVGVNVLSPFLAQKRTCGWQIDEEPGAGTSYVITDAAPNAGAGMPVVVHRIF
jgi:hypothetical protein